MDDLVDDLDGLSCYEEADRIAKSDSFSRLCSTVTTADYSAGMEGEDWDEVVVFACEAVLSWAFCG